MNFIQWIFGCCEHKYTKWQIIDTVFSEYFGSWRILQSRKCINCGYVQLKSE